MMSLTRLFPVAALAMLAAGCTDVRVVEPGSGQSYYDGVFEYATRDGSIKTVVVGAPFVPGATNVAALTTETMKGANRGPTVDFVPVSWPQSDGGYRVVVVFNGATAFTAEDVCKLGAELPTAPTAAETTMDISFCIGKDLISSAKGYTKPLAGPQDPRYRDLVRGTTLAMIPPADINKLSGGEVNP